MVATIAGSGQSLGDGSRRRADVSIAEAAPSAFREITDSIRRDLGKLRRRDEAEDVHHLRSQLRRLRAVERVYADELNPVTARALHDERRRLSHRLGAVRDLDVMLSELPHALSGQRDDLRQLRGGWRADRRRAQRRLARELRSGRCATFVAALEHVATGAAVRRRDPAIALRHRAAARVIEEFGGLLAERVDPHVGDPEAIHRLRIAAKRFRYTVEALDEVLGSEGRATAAQVVELQDAAGALHDAHVLAERALSWRRSNRRNLRHSESRAIARSASAHRARAEAARAQLATELAEVRGLPFRRRISLMATRALEG